MQAKTVFPYSMLWEILSKFRCDNLRTYMIVKINVGIKINIITDAIMMTLVENFATIAVVVVLAALFLDGMCSVANVDT
jgi:hypothetical protein